MSTHRPTAAPKHRNTETPSYLLILLLLVGCVPDRQSKLTSVPPPNLDQIDLINITDGTLIRESWSVHRVQGYKLGHRWTRVYRDTSTDQAILHTIVIDDLLIPRFNATSHQILRSATRCFERGSLLQMEYEVESRGQRRRLTGQVVGDRLYVQQVIGARTSSSDIPWSADDGGFFALERSLAANPLQPGQFRDVTAWLPLIDQRQTYRLTATDWEDQPLDGVPTRLLQINVTAAPATSPSPLATRNSPLASPPSLVFWTDAEGHVVRRWRRILDQTTERSTRSAAMAPNESLRFDIALDVRVPLRPAWPDSTSADDATFHIRLAQGNPASQLAQSAYQRVTSIDGATAEVRVVTKLPPRPEFRAAETPPTAHDVQPNKWLESNHATIRQFAQAHDAAPQSKQEIALDLRDRVAATLQAQAFGGSLTTAASALKQRSGDCTEHAMLLAAACRARQVPARVAIGLIYVPRDQAFEYHMWTEFWTGAYWRPLDATLGSATVPANRLKLSDTDLSEESDYGIIAPVLRVMGRMEIERISRPVSRTR